MAKWRESNGDEWKGEAADVAETARADYVRCEVNDCATAIDSIERCVGCGMNGCPACVLFGDAIAGRRCVRCGAAT